MSNHVEVFWRPGCPECREFRALLLDHEVDSSWHNTWYEPQAREVLQQANCDPETMPIVRVGSNMLANPSWHELAPLIGRDPDEPARPPTRRPYASAGSCSRPSNRRSSIGLIVVPSALLLLLTNGSVAAIVLTVIALTWWLAIDGRRRR